MRVLLLVAAAAAGLLPPPAAAETPAEAKLRRADARVEAAATPAARAEGLVALAAAHTARARESGDGAHYERALDALARARETDPGLDALAKIEAWVRLGRHEFARAEALARAHLAAHPDDAEAWGLLGDARMELGRSDGAAEAYQHMMDLRPGPGAYLRAAYWLERAGDPARALDLLERALAATPREEAEQRAWIRVQGASLEERLGRPARASAALHAALAEFPDYHYALSALAGHHLARGRPAQALPWARAALEAAPHPERWLALADALRGLGREAEARAAEDTFLRGALAHVDRFDNENLHLVDFYLDRRPDPERAYAIARREAKRRPDPPTLARLERARAARPRSP